MRYLAGFAGDRFVPEAGQRVYLRFNRHGYRGPDRPLRAPEGVRRLAVLGDSFVAGIAIREENLMTSRLERLLNRHTGGHRWEVLNFGVSGYGTAQALHTWRSVARQYQPDLVLLCFFNGNDLIDNHRQLSHAHRPYYDLADDGSLVLHPVSPTKASFSRRLSQCSRLYVWQRHKVRAVRDLFRPPPKTDSPGYVIMDHDPHGPVEESWQVTEALLERLAQDVRVSGAQLAVLDIAAPEQLVDASWTKLIHALGPSIAKDYDRDYPQTRLRDICGRCQIPFLALIEPFRDTGQPEKLHFGGVGHWNEKGHALAAQLVYEQFPGLAIAFKE